MKTKLLIFPFNGNGFEAINCLGYDFDFIGFIDDTPEKQGKNKFGFEVFDRKAINKFRDAKILAVPGGPDTFLSRSEVIKGLNIPVERFASIIHPKATISEYSQIGYNILIMAGVVITANAKIGDHVCILPNSIVHHDSIISNYSLIGSNVSIAGSTVIGENCYIGSGCSIINNIEIGEKTLIGIGSNVIRPLPANCRAAGNPAVVIFQKKG